MENKADKKELDDIIKEINNVAKELVDEYVSGEDKFVPEEERAELNEKGIKAPFNDTEKDNPFKVSEEEMNQLIKIEDEIKDIINNNNDIYIGRGKKGETLYVMEYCQSVGVDNFSILEYIGDDKEKLKECLKIKPKTKLTK